SPSRRPCYHRRRHRENNPPPRQRRHRCKQTSFLNVAQSAGGGGNCDARCHCRLSKTMTKRSGFLPAVDVAAVGRRHRRRSRSCLGGAGRPGRSGSAPEPTGSYC
ncbi:unnamed protein product, partial [Ectocarpus sp. 8 AP-2014]